MKEVENWLNEREKLVKISKKETFEFKNNENSSFYKEKLKLQAAFTKINQEFENLNKEKITSTVFPSEARYSATPPACFFMAVAEAMP